MLTAAKEPKLHPTKKPKQSLEEWVYENLEAIIIAIVLALVLRYFVMEAFKIPTGSMAPRLLGVHRLVTCPECDFTFTRGVRTDPDTGAYDPSLDNYPRAECPLDGTEFDIKDDPVIGGNRILVNKYLYDFKEPNRWDVIVFRYPKDPTKNYIKRCVAKTGEVLDIRNGDIYINDEIARKPWNVQDHVWLPVYDSAHVMGGTHDPDWKAKGWKLSPNRFETDDDNGTYSLTFENTPIYDNYGYAGPHGSDGSRVVGDLLLTFQFDPDTDGQFEILLGEDIDRFVAQFKIDGNKMTYTLLRLQQNNEQSVVAEVTDILLLDSMNSMYLADVDNQIRCKINGNVIGEEYQWDNNSMVSYYENHVKITAVDCMMNVQNLQIHRDIHYIYDASSPLHDKMEEANREGRSFYVGFGDHSPSSADSRTWGIIPAENLIGRAIVIFWPPKQSFPWMDFKIVR